MYSRKYIRSPVNALTGIPISSSVDSLSADHVPHSPFAGISSTAGELNRPSAIQSEKRSVPLPPDYTGMAFSLQNREDYPETVIEHSAKKRSSDPKEAQASLLMEDTPPGDSMQSNLPDTSSQENAFPLQEKDTPSLPIQSEQTPNDHPEEQASPDVAKEQSGNLPLEPLPSILTPEFLRSLTLEDLLLIWMLLMLTVSSQDDQVYLLLGLLLFHR